MVAGVAAVRVRRGAARLHRSATYPGAELWEILDARGCGVGSGALTRDYPERAPRRIIKKRTTGEVAVAVIFGVEIERETDGRWLAEVPELPGVLAYGGTEDEALSRVQALALRVVADRLENDEAGGDFLSISFNAA